MRKVFLIFALMALTVIGAEAQDLITKRNGSELNVKVIEIGENEVKYRNSGDDSGPLRTISKSEIFRIKYANGSTDVFNQTQPQPQPQPVQNSGSGSYGSGNGGYGNGGYGGYGGRSRGNSGDSDYRKGYAGVGLGAAMLLEDYDYIDGTGLQFNVNFGYLFSSHVGITGSFMLTQYNADNDVKTGLRGGVVGPLISFSNSEHKVEYDIRPTLGVVSGKVNYKNESLSSDKMALLVGFGGSIRWNVSQFISLTGNLDTYFHGELEANDLLFEKLSSVGVSVGVNFRF
jgi:hypothetical protein